MRDRGGGGVRDGGGGWDMISRSHRTTAGALKAQVTEYIVGRKGHLMRWTWWMAGLAGCGDIVTTDPPTPYADQASFKDAYESAYCLQWVECGFPSLNCPFREGRPAYTDVVPDLFTEECVFDSVAADACLDGDWGCDPAVPGIFGEVIPPEECAEVCVSV